MPFTPVGGERRSKFLPLYTSAYLSDRVRKTTQKESKSVTPVLHACANVNVSAKVASIVAHRKQYKVNNNFAGKMKLKTTSRKKNNCRHVLNNNLVVRRKSVGETWHQTKNNA
jgi:hypothetical protein